MAGLALVSPARLLWQGDRGLLVPALLCGAELRTHPVEPLLTVIDLDKRTWGCQHHLRLSSTIVPRAFRNGLFQTEQRQGAPVWPNDYHADAHPPAAEGPPHQGFGTLRVALIIALPLAA